MKLPALLIAALFLSACSQSASPTGPSASSGFASGGATQASLLAVVPPNSSFEGTGTNPGLGAPNSCPTDAPTIIKTEDGKTVKFTANKIAGYPQFRGYQWVFTFVDAGKARRTFAGQSNVDDNQQGREFAIAVNTFESGSWTVQAFSRRRGCQTEFGTGSNILAFSGSDVNSGS